MRHTAIRPLDDVDVIFVIDASQWKTTWVQALLSALPSPDRVLETLDLMRDGWLRAPDLSASGSEPAGVNDGDKSTQQGNVEVLIQ